MNVAYNMDCMEGMKSLDDACIDLTVTSPPYDNLRDYNVFVWSKGRPKTANMIVDRLNLRGGTKIHGTYRQPDGQLKPSNGIGKRDVPEYGRRFNVWEISEEKNNRTGHPAVFPIQLASDHIKSWSNEGDTVLDPFLGSGTTRIAAYDLKRDFIGYEISKEYFDKQEERFARHTAQLNLFIDGVNV